MDMQISTIKLWGNGASTAEKTDINPYLSPTKLPHTRTNEDMWVGSHNCVVNMELNLPQLLCTAPNLQDNRQCLLCWLGGLTY